VVKTRKSDSFYSWFFSSFRSFVTVNVPSRYMTVTDFTLAQTCYESHLTWLFDFRNKSALAFPIVHRSIVYNRFQPSQAVPSVSGCFRPILIVFNAKGLFREIYHFCYEVKTTKLFNFQVYWLNSVKNI